MTAGTASIAVLDTMHTGGCNAAKLVPWGSASYVEGFGPPGAPEGPCKGRLPSIREEDEESDIEHGLLNDGH